MREGETPRDAATVSGATPDPSSASARDSVVVVVVDIAGAPTCGERTE